MGKQHTPDFGPATRTSGDQHTPDVTENGPNSYTPGWGKTPPAGFPADRGPQGDHMDATQTSDFVPPIATRPGVKPDLSNPLK